MCHVSKGIKNMRYRFERHGLEYKLREPEKYRFRKINGGIVQAQLL
jgi:hypothetical protein